MTKKYKLKPGRHQFAPGSPASFTNDNITDEEAEWYLERYPHIAGLFVGTLEGCKVKMLKKANSKPVENQTTENSETETITLDTDQ